MQLPEMLLDEERIARQPLPASTGEPALSLRTAFLSLSVVGLLALIGTVALSPHRRIYDELYYVNYIWLFRKYGLTAQFLNSLPAAAGPLYAFVHIGLAPITGLDPVGMRFVNVCLLAATVAVLGASLKPYNHCYFWGPLLLSLSVPMTWVIAGMALSEMPAILLVTASICLILSGLDRFSKGRSLWNRFVPAALCLGRSACGRQPYLLLIGVPALLGLLQPRLRLAAVVFGALAAAVAAPLFFIWGGLTPPSSRYAQGFSITHGLFSLSYTGICLFLVAPRFFRIPVLRLLGFVASVITANCAASVVELYPLRSLSARILPAASNRAYGLLCGGLFLAIGVVFLFQMLTAIWQNRHDLRTVAACSGLMLVSLSPVFIVHTYSSRYTAMALPFVILSADRWRAWRIETLLLNGLGMGLGFLSLFGYFF